MQEALKARQANVDNINSTMQQMREEAQSMGASVPDRLRKRVDKLNNDWSKIRQMAGNLRPTSDADLARKMAMQQAGKVKNHGHGYPNPIACLGPLTNILFVLQICSSMNHQSNTTMGTILECVRMFLASL